MRRSTRSKQWLVSSLMMLCACSGRAPKSLGEAFQGIGPQTKSFTITAAGGGTVQGEMVSFEVPAGVFFDPAAQPFDSDLDNDGTLDSKAVTGEVRLDLKEYKSAGDMLRGDMPTQTSSGAWLESGGSFILKAFVGTSEVRIGKLNNVLFSGAPVSAAGDPMELWLAKGDDEALGWDRPVAAPPAPLSKCDNADTCHRDPDCSNQPACRALLCDGNAAGQNVCGNNICLGTEACPIKPECAVANACVDDPTCAESLDCQVKCTGSCDTAECLDVPVCKPAPILASGASSPGFLFNNMPFGNIGGYNAANCDAISFLSTDRLTMFVRFASNYSTDSGVFFIPDGNNTTIKLYTEISGAPAGQEGYRSYDLSMPIGVSGKLVIVALNEGKYYYQELPYTIADDNSEGAKSATVLVNPVEVTESEFNANLAAL